MSCIDNLISIIIPVYNAGGALENCLKSVISQSFTNWELHLIDDGSTDSSRSICDSYSSVDPRIKVTHLENGGVSRARNVGLEKVNGSWVLFLDSDDELLPEALENYSKYFNYDIDVIRAGFERVKPGDIQIISTNSLLETADKELVLKTCATSRYEAYIWNSCFRKSAIGSIRFDEEISWCEDHLFTFSVIGRARKVLFIPEAVYRYYAPVKTAHAYGTNLSTRFIEPKMILREAILERHIKTSYFDTPSKDAQQLIEHEFDYKIRMAIRYAIEGNRYLTALSISFKYHKHPITTLFSNILHIKIAPSVRRLIN